MRTGRLFDVRPRYGAGSPGYVDEETARRVARDEEHFYRIALAGYVGIDEKKKAERFGLKRIVYQLAEKRGKWFSLTDMITKEVIEGREAVEREMAAIGTRVAPRPVEQALERVFGYMRAHEIWQDLDYIDRRRILETPKDDLLRELFAMNRNGVIPMR
jgi:hypothetical protein